MGIVEEELGMGIEMGGQRCVWGLLKWVGGSVSITIRRVE